MEISKDGVIRNVNTRTGKKANPENCDCVRARAGQWAT